VSPSSWIDEYAVTLERHGYTNGPQVCRWIIAHILNQRNRPNLPVVTLSPEQMITFTALHSRVVSGEPLQYVLGTTEFYNCEIKVGPGVLIPRPETELLVELALKLYQGRGNILDLCTGSGCIPLAMALERPDIPSLIGIDCSSEALYWAEDNLKALHPKNVEFRQSDLFSAVKGEPFEMITANPPYISLDAYADLSDTVKKHEPEQALFADDEGMSILRRIISGAQNYLLDRGWLICEIGFDQGPKTKQFFEDNGFVDVQILKDYAGQDRIVGGQKTVPVESVD